MKKAFEIHSEPHEIRITRTDARVPLVVQKANPNERPYLHPLSSPCQRAVMTEDRPPHHPWQHGLYIGLNDVNGVGFWSEGLQKAKAHLDGTFHPEPLSAPMQVGEKICWEVRTQYRTPQGERLLHESQQWALRDRGVYYTLDLAWTLRAAQPVRFGKYAYGGLFLRMPFKTERGAEILTASGCREQGKADAQRTEWVAISMPLDGIDGHAGMAIFDHPSNDGYPLPWRVDHQYGIGPGRCILSEWNLNEGEAKTFQHRTAVFSGKPDPELLRHLFLEYSK